MDTCVTHSYCFYFGCKLCSAGQDRALTRTITNLEHINKKPEAEELSNMCKRGERTVRGLSGGFSTISRVCSCLCFKKGQSAFMPHGKWHPISAGTALGSLNGITSESLWSLCQRWDCLSQSDNIIVFGHGSTIHILAGLLMCKMKRHFIFSCHYKASAAPIITNKKVAVARCATLMLLLSADTRTSILWPLSQGCPTPGLEGRF